MKRSWVYTYHWVAELPRRTLKKETLDVKKRLKDGWKNTRRLYGTIEKFRRPP